MFIEYLDTGILSQSKRRKLIFEYKKKEKICSNCGSPAYPAHINTVRNTSFLRLHWYSSGDEVCCSKSCVSSLTNSKIAKSSDSYKKRGIKSSETQRGRTYEEIYGEELAKKRKNEISKRLSEDNPRWSLKHRTLEEIEYQKELNRNRENNPFSKLCKGKTYEELYGVEKSNLLKEKLSIRFSGVNNPNVW